MNYVTDDTMNAYLRSVQPMYDGVLGEIQKEAIAARYQSWPPEVARLLSGASDDAEAEKYSGNRHSRSLFRRADVPLSA